MRSQLVSALAMAVLFILIPASAVTAAGVTYYVSPFGSDTNPGTIDAPWRSLEKASGEAQAGNTVVIMPGVYTGILQPVNSGTEGAPITFRAAERGTVSLVGNGDNRFPITLRDVAHIVIEGIHVNPQSQTPWVEIRFAKFVRIADSVFVNAFGNVPFIISESEQIRVEDSVFRRWSSDASLTEPVGIDMIRVYGSRHIVFEGNAISSALHTPIQFRPEGRNEFIVVRGNVFHNESGRNYEFFGTDYVLFEGNIVTNGFHGSRSASSENKFSAQRGIYRYNRVFANWGETERFFPFYIQDNLHELRAYHNVFDGNPAYGVRVESDRPGQRLFVNNIIVSNDQDGFETQVHRPVGSSIRFVRNVIWPTPPPDLQVLLEQSVYAPPEFVDSHRYNHQLSATSPLVDSGMHLTHATGDGEGTVLPVADAMYFYDGFGIAGEVGDVVAIGTSTQRARVVRVDYGANTLELDREVTWSHGDPVSLPWEGDAPDIGVYEYGHHGGSMMQVVQSDFSLTPGQRVALRADVSGLTDPVVLTWHLGDGVVLTGSEMTHFYEEPGDYAIRVRVLDGDGNIYRATGYVVVSDVWRSEQDPLLSFTFDVGDTEWWRYWRTYKPEPASWRRLVESQSGQGYLRVTAPEGNVSGILPAWVYPSGWGLGEIPWWEIDTYPFVQIRYRIEPETPIALYLQAYGGLAGRRVVLAKTAPHRDKAVQQVGNLLLVDDGEWHELVVDARQIRQVYPDVQRLHGIGFQTGDLYASGEGAYDIDTFTILPAGSTVKPHHVEILIPRDTKPLSGTVVVELRERSVTSDMNAQVEVWLGEIPVYSGVEVPGTLTIETEDLPNGTFPLTLRVMYGDGRTFFFGTTLELQNNWELLDHLQPPLSSAFFGHRDRSLTSARSSGWTYESDDPRSFFGDTSRMRPTSSHAEYLEWEVPALSAFEVTVYSQTDDLESMLMLLTSTDADVWSPTPYALQRDGGTELGWTRVVLTASVPSEDEVNRFRFVVDAQGDEGVPIQIGQAWFTGRIPRETGK